MNYKIILGYLLVLVMVTQGCTKNIDQVSEDPNRTTQVNPGNLLTYLSIQTFGPEFAGLQRYLDTHYIDWRFGGYHLNWNRRNFTREYRFLTIASKMDLEAERTNQPVYSSLSKFFKSYWIFNVTRLYGDVPYSQANKMDEGIDKPAYDSQESIIATILQDLEAANTELAEYEDVNINGDIIYGGNVQKWRKLINMLRLRVLINASAKETINGESVKQMFVDIVVNPSQNPLMEDLNDSPIRYEEDNPDNYFLFGNNNFLSGYRITQFLAEFMKDREDHRLFVFAQPTIYAEENNLDPNNFANYAGTNPFPDQANNTNYPLEDSKKVSRVDNRYHRNPIGPPTMVIGYPEQEFILAEAALRGWINDDPQVHYENGIRASFEYFGVGDNAEEYLQDPLVQLTGTDTEKLKKIITEKYLNFFMQGGYEPYFELRRTGYPDYAEYVTPDISTLYNEGNLPLRYLYPMGEITDNTDNVTEAINNLGEGDNIFSKMWLLQGNDPLRNPIPFPYQ